MFVRYKGLKWKHNTFYGFWESSLTSGYYTPTAGDNIEIKFSVSYVKMGTAKRYNIRPRYFFMEQHWINNDLLVKKMGNTKSCTHLYPAPYSSTQFHSPPPSLFQVCQYYKNENAARN